jgi:AbiV family abortive infection protein
LRSKTNYPRPSLAEIARGIHLALKNAEDLLSDAKILNKNGRTARAFALCVLAIEEVGKSQMIARLSQTSLSDQGGLKSFWKKFRSHGHKFGVAYLAQHGLAVQSASKKTTPEQFAKQHIATEHLIEDLKQLAFYVDFVEGHFTIPQELFVGSQRTRKFIIDPTEDIIKDIRELNPSERDIARDLRRFSNTMRRIGLNPLSYGDIDPILDLYEAIAELV